MKKIIATLILIASIGLITNCNSNDDADTLTTPNEPTTQIPAAAPETIDKGNINPNQPNILLIIADDMGLDATPGYNIGSQKPTMPILQGLINHGITYNNVWSNPTCTPTRAGIITGKHGFRTGVTKVDDALPTTETSLQKNISQKTNNTYAQAVIGKWHLSKEVNHPNDMGIDYYAGSLSGSVASYTNWNLTINGETNTSTVYNTTKYTDLSIDWISNQTKPWFLWLAYNAPHTPFHLPPTNLHTQGDLPTDDASIDANPQAYFFAMIEAMDTEIGRLLESLPETVRNNTLIIFVGDNGTSGRVVQEFNRRRAKGSVYKGGINVPMIVSGAKVSRTNETDEALINTLDLFATISNLAGASSEIASDSSDFSATFTTPNSTQKSITYSEVGTNLGTDKTIRNATHKYILFDDGTEALYNLDQNPLENPNLLSPEQSPLSAEDSAIRDSFIEELNNNFTP